MKIIMADAADLSGLPFYESEATPEDRAETEAWRVEQIAPVKDAPPLTRFKLTCGCSYRFDWWEMYRCLYCGVFFCKTCAQIHFGKRVPEEGDHE